MKKLRYFKCTETQEVFERLVSDAQLNVKCNCGANALKQLSAPRSFGNTLGKSPSSRY